MPDRKKVMTALAICTGRCKCLGCWYGQNNPDFRCQERLMSDALALLREQKPDIARCEDCKYAVRTSGDGHVKYCRLWQGDKDGSCDCEKVIKRFQDAADVLEDAIAPLTKHGHWLVLKNCSNAGVYCSECKTKVFDHYPTRKKLSYFCPHCGAKIEGEKVL